MEAARSSNTANDAIFTKCSALARMAISTATSMQGASKAPILILTCSHISFAMTLPTGMSVTTLAVSMAANWHSGPTHSIERIGPMWPHIGPRWR
jgi:hypothetical protein